MEINKERSLVIIFMIGILLPIAIDTAHSTGNDLNLPTIPVTIEVFNGTESYFLTKLLDVPSGYDITNGTYLGWCVDTRAEMTRSPATHSVYLYSSLNPPGELANEEWDMVNYILNHKPENATADDIQEAIWYFINIDGNYTPKSQTAWNIVNDALQNGEGFTPENGQIVAVICYPVKLLPYPSDVQISIIEVEKNVTSERPEVEPNNEQPTQPIQAWILAVIIALLVITTSIIVLRKRKGRNKTR